MNDVLLLGVGVVVGGSLGWVLGARLGAGRVRRDLSSLLTTLRSGDVSDAGEGASREVPAVRELRSFLSRSWIPRTQAREESMREALKRLAEYLRHRVEAPLLVGLDEGGDSLKTGADAALDAVEDLEFFLEDPPVVPVLEERNLVDLMGEVTQEFHGQFTIYLKVEGSQAPLRLQVDPEPLKDALFLVLHNAGEFGGGQPVDMVIHREDDRVRVFVRDRGPGFSQEALAEALSPFFSTSPGGLGLGLPYAKMAVRAQGGDILIRNRPGGGAEVEILLPLTR